MHPRCFAIKLTRATTEVIEARASTTDDQFIVRHKNGILDFIATRHVGDIKVACEPAVLPEFIAALEKVVEKGRAGYHPRQLH